MRERIVSGKDAPGSLLPTEQDLTDRHAISRTVVRQAMQALASEGLIVRIAGKGTFVRGAGDARPQAWSVGSLDELLAYGLDTRLEILSRRKITARLSVARALGIDAGARVLEIRGLRYSKQGLFSYQSNYFLADIGDALAAADLSRGSLLEALQERVSLRLTHAEQMVTAASADPDTARQLQIAEGSPVLIIHRVFVSAERGPVEVGIMRYRPDRFRYESRLTRTAAGAAIPSLKPVASGPAEGRRLVLIRDSDASSARTTGTRLGRKKR